jgi:predicted TIM-barrel fold metal-dependent hydrolase
MIVEWNTHIFASDVARYPFHAQAAYRPDASHLLADPLSDYLQRMDRFGIDRAVIVQPEPYGDDHRLVLACLRRETERLKATSLFYPKDPEAVTKLQTLVNVEPRIVATRFHAHRGKEMYLDSFADPAVRALWRKAGELGLVIELHIGPNYARQVAEAIRAFPSFPVLIDHLAEPGFGAPEEYEDVLALAQFPNVTMKLSGLNHFSKEAEPYFDTRALVRRVAEAYGPDHLAWSSGSPGIVDALLGHWSEADREKVKGGNLARLTGFAP